MSLGDGLAKALTKYLFAKQKYGLRSLLLSEVDLSDSQFRAKIKVAQDNSLEFQQPDEDQDRAVLGTGPTAGFKIKCPACKDGVLSFVEGCVKCHSCGYSQC